MDLCVVCRPRASAEADAMGPRRGLAKGTKMKCWTGGQTATAVANVLEAVANLSCGGLVQEIQLRDPVSRCQNASAEAAGPGRPENRDITYYMSRIADIRPEEADDPLAEDDGGAGEVRRPQLDAVQDKAVAVSFAPRKLQHEAGADDAILSGPGGISELLQAAPTGLVRGVCKGSGLEAAGAYFKLVDEALELGPVVAAGLDLAFEAGRLEAGRAAENAGAQFSVERREPLQEAYGRAGEGAELRTRPVQSVAEQWASAAAGRVPAWPPAIPGPIPKRGARSTGCPRSRGRHRREPPRRAGAGRDPCVREPWPDGRLAGGREGERQVQLGFRGDRT